MHRLQFSGPVHGPVYTFGHCPQNHKNHVLAVIGDGAITGGMAYEAMNHAGFLDSNMIVILNDNQQVSLPTQYNGQNQDPVGALSGALARLQANRCAIFGYCFSPLSFRFCPCARLVLCVSIPVCTNSTCTAPCWVVVFTSDAMFGCSAATPTSNRPLRELREIAKGVTKQLPEPIQEATAKIDEYARGMISGSGSTLFEELGLYYIGPVDGHNLSDLIDVLNGALVQQFSHRLLCN